MSPSFGTARDALLAALTEIEAKIIALSEKMDLRPMRAEANEYERYLKRRALRAQSNAVIAASGINTLVADAIHRVARLTAERDAWITHTELLIANGGATPGTYDPDGEPVDASEVTL